MADVQAQKIPIYVSYLTFSNMLDWLHEMGTVPSKFDRSLWGKKFGGSTGGQLVAGMKFLGLLDGENTTAVLDKLAMATADERKALIAALLRDAYGAGIVDELPRMTVKMLNDAFDDLGATDATRRKAISFFINAAKAADLPLHSMLAKQARNRPAAARKPAIPQKDRQKPDGAKPDAPEVRPPAHTPWQEALDPTILTWLQRIPAADKEWPPAEREKWQHVFKTICDGVWGGAAEK